MARRNTARHDFTIKTAQVLAERVAFHCSNPDCRVHTVGPHSASDKSVKIGEAAHITAASEDGPRYDGALTPEQRRSPDNGIWLCCDCHTLIDRDPGRFPTEELRRWKQQAEQLAFADLTGATGDAPTRAKQGPCLEVIERVLRRYCDDRVLEWEEARADPEDPDKLKHYVEPHYSLLKKGLRPVDTSSTLFRSPPVGAVFCQNRQLRVSLTPGPQASQMEGISCLSMSTSERRIRNLRPVARHRTSK
jgi:hypothetical protein